MSERMTEEQGRVEPYNRAHGLRRAAGKWAARLALVASGTAALFTGVSAAEAATGQEKHAQANSWRDSYDEFNLRANAAERSWCSVPSRISLCYDVMKVIAEEATQSAQYVAEKYQWSLHNGRADAFRHCFFMAKVTREHGAWTAKEFGDRHEEGVPDGIPEQPEEEKAMDLQNNIEGRRIGVTEGSIFNRCVDAAASGQLVIMHE